MYFQEDSKQTWLQHKKHYVRTNSGQFWKKKIQQ